MSKHLQLELFKTRQRSPKKSTPINRTKFFAFIRLYEKAISFLIVLVIVALVFFSMGVERGKTLTVNINQQDEGPAEQASPEKERARPEESTATNVLLANQSEPKKDISKYTVQVATFKTTTYAQKEAKRLEGKGIEALVIPKGKYVIVCVGDFSEMQKAKEFANQMKKTYHDCFIRRL